MVNEFGLLNDVWSSIATRLSLKGAGSLSSEEQQFARVWMLVAEVENGGLAQYLFNCYGGDGLLAVEALRVIGEADLANELCGALAALPGGGPAGSIAERQNQIDALDPSQRILERFDEAMRERAFRVRELMVSYVRQHLLPNGRC